MKSENLFKANLLCFLLITLGIGLVSCNEDNNETVNNPTPNITCQGETKLKDGKCVLPITCAEGQGVESGACVATCSEGKTIIDGECKAGEDIIVDVDNVTCPEGEVLENGVCVAAKDCMANSDCNEGQECGAEGKCVIKSGPTGENPIVTGEETISAGFNGYYGDAKMIMQYGLYGPAPFSEPHVQESISKALDIDKLIEEGKLLGTEGATGKPWILLCKDSQCKDRAGLYEGTVVDSASNSETEPTKSLDGGYPGNIRIYGIKDASNPLSILTNSAKRDIEFRNIPVGTYWVIPFLHSVYNDQLLEKKCDPKDLMSCPTDLDLVRINPGYVASQHEINPPAIIQKVVITNDNPGVADVFQICKGDTGSACGMGVAYCAKGFVFGEEGESTAAMGYDLATCFGEEEEKKETACEAQTDCEEGSSCTENKCVPSNTPPPDESETTCPAGQHLEGNTCV
ncbi:MAG: hypothetical protein ACD_73C00596G0002, partial [uncultured bacterium]